MKKKILFVCLGNICRSPSAEAVMNACLHTNQLDTKFECDSAGTEGWHSGMPADNRMKKHALKRGFELTSLARQFNPKDDFKEFDWIIGMDQQNVIDLKSFAKNSADLNKIKSMTDYCSQFENYNAVPDPYYGGADGFELVLDILEDACEGLLKELT